jgi:hypothetical protein
MFHPPMMCPWQCHQIGGPWISMNPSCPFHGLDPLPRSEADSDAFDIDPEEGERMCREETARREEEDRRRAESEPYEGEGEDF